MPRPRKWRIVGYIPEIRCFGPITESNRDIEFITLNIEEVESIRLMDLVGLDQVSCAEKMGVARSTFQRIYTLAKGKVADSLINGKRICIEGGNYTLNICEISCRECGTRWKESYENVINNKLSCPKCKSTLRPKCCSSDKKDICFKCEEGFCEDKII